MYGHNNRFKTTTSNRGQSNDFRGHSNSYFRGHHSNNFRGQQSNDFRGQHSNNFRGQHSNDFRGQYSDFRGQHSNDFRGQQSNDFNDFRGQQSNDFCGQQSNDFRGQHSNSNDYLLDFSSQPRHKNYGQNGQMVAPQFQHNYYRQMNVSQHQNSYEQSGYPQRHYPSQRDRSNMQRNQNHNRFQQERAINHGNEYKNYICPGCSQHFDFSGRCDRYFGRIPFILNCQHTVCQDCIHKTEADNSIICPVCRISSELPDRGGGDCLEEVFTPNFYILGLIAWAKPPGTQLLLVSPPTTKNKKSVIPEPLEPLEPEGEKCGYLTCYKRAVMRCRDCNDVFCADCCTMVHKNVKSMWSHVQVQITNGDFSSELEKCLEHGGMDVELYCNTCDIGACCYCFIEKHESHEKEYLSKLNIEELNEFQICKDKAEQVLKQLHVSKRKLKNMCDGGTSSTEKQIYSYFGDLFGRLHVFQKKLIKEVSSSQNFKSDNSVAKLLSNLDDSIMTWKNILAAAESVTVQKINLRGILKLLRGVDMTPCYLLHESSSDVNITEFCPNPILDNLDNLFTVKQSNDYKLKLVNTNDLPPDYVKDPIELQYELEMYGSSSSNDTHSTRKDESNSYNKKVSSQSGSSKGKSCGPRKRLDRKAVRGNILVKPTD